MDELRARCEWGELTDTEHAELIQYEDRLEQWRVERLQALMELAKLRNIDLLTLNRQFRPGSKPLVNVKGRVSWFAESWYRHQ